MSVGITSVFFREYLYVVYVMRIGARAAERFVRSDRLEDAVAEMHEGMRHYAREAGLRVGREAAERALLRGPFSHAGGGG